jgi:hypothetical protein
MTKLSLLSLCLIALSAPALAQDASSSASSAPADQTQAGPPVSSADAFKIFVDTCTDISSGDPAAYDRANSSGWTANEGQDTGPYNKVYSGYRELDGLGEVDIWGSVQSFPTQRLGYCRIDFSDENNLLDFKDMAGLKGLTGATTAGENGDVYGAWEAPDKKLLVIGDRTDGVVELEFNLLLGDKPAP